MKILTQYGVIPHKRFKFAGGEVQIRLDLEEGNKKMIDRDVTIVAEIHSSDDLMELLLVTDALRRAYNADITLLMPYLPYARQDRVCAEGEALSLRVFCDIINAQRYHAVIVVDPHSDVGPALLNNSFAFGAESVLEKNKAKLGNIANAVLVSPDAGAIKRTTGVAKTLGLPMICADKCRDPATGAITGTVVHSTAHIGDKDFLIVDDICDGGRTFIELAKQLRALTDGKVNLYVTHGIFSQGPQVFDGLIDHIYVAHPFSRDLPDNFTILVKE